MRALCLVLALAHAAVADSIVLDARISYAQHALRSPHTGTVRRVVHARGDRVRAGDRMFTIAYVEIPPSAALESARADLRNSARNARRARDLMERGEPRKDFEQAEGEYRQARATYERLARNGHTYEVAIAAPVAGEVLAVLVAVGDPAIAADDPEQRPVADLATIGERDRVLATASSRCDGSWRIGVAVAFVSRTARATGTISGTTQDGCAIATIDNAARVLEDGATGELVVAP